MKTFAKHSVVFLRVSPESRDLLAWLVSVDPLDPLDPLDCLVPLERLVVRYKVTIFEDFLSNCYK